MKKPLLFLLSLCIYCVNSSAQVTGVRNVPGSYPTLAAAIADLNAVGVGAGGATINLGAGFTETAPAGGYQLGSAVLNASTSSTSQLTIVGTNAILTSPVGTSTSLDGIFTLIGTDYVTLSGLEFRESAANTTATTAMEWGLGFFHRNAAAPYDGCQNNTVSNCKFVLNRTIATPSKGVFISHQVVNSTTSLFASAGADMHSYNRIYGNSFENMITAVYMGGTTAANDVGNDIGGTSASTGNIMRNVLGALYSSIGAVTAIYQTQCNISYNTIDHMAAGGTPSIATSWGIYAYGPSSVYTVNNNTITMVEQSISTAYAVYGIYGNAASPTITAQNNTITISEIAGGSAVNNFAIFLPNANSTTITNNTVTQNMAVSGTTYGIYTTSSGTTITSDNTITQTSSAATSSQFYSIVSGGTNTVSETITNNKFANSNVSVVGTTGLMALIYTANGTGNKNISGNSIVGTITHNSPSDFYGILCNPASVQAGTSVVANNNFSGINKSGAGGFYGAYYAPTVTASAQNYDFHDNIISNITNAGSGVAIGLFVGSGNNANIYKNRISNMISAGGNLHGIYRTIPDAAGVYNIYQNEVYGLRGTAGNSSVNGITIGTGTRTNVHNNFIYGLQATTASAGADAVRGINLINTQANSEINVYYNSVYLNAISSGVNFSTSGIYHAASATATTAALDLRNNIIVNTSTANGTGVTSVIRRGGTAFANYKTSSNNNVLYAGTPSSTKLIYYDGTNSDQTLAAFQTRSGAEGASLNINPNFTSATNLHLIANANCAIDGKATPIAGYATDFDGDARNASTPDIGADEFANTFLLTITNPAAVCVGGTVDITASAITSGSSAGTTSYWMDANATTAIPAGNGTPSAISVAGTYYIKLDNGMGCSDVKPVTVTINTAPAATISYPASPYCQNGGTATVTHTGAAGGTYSSTAGLSIDGSTGAINLGASTPGTFLVTYTIPAAGPCASSTTTANITISTTPTATISYAASPYCQNGGTATITQTGSSGGIYSSTAGLSIDGSTGAVNLAASTPGTYTVTYFIAAASGCSSFSTTTNITITTPPTATISYTASPYCQNAGTASVTQTGSAGGTYSSTAGLSINGSTGAINLGASTPGAYTVTYTVAAAGGCAVFTTTANITVTATPAATINYAASPYCQNGGTANVTQTGNAGGTYSSTTGLSINASTGAINLGASTPGTYTVTYTVPAANGCNVFSTTTSITITTLSVAPTGATSNITTSCGPANVTLTVNGGSLGTGASWKWYSASCGGTPIGTGTSITQAVTATTTFYVRAEGSCNNTPCASVTVTINAQPTISITAAPYTSLMPGMVTTLYSTSAPVAPGNTINWYLNGGTTPVATGNIHTVTIDGLGTYTARLTTADGCTALSNAVLIKDSINLQFFISPVPNNGLFNVRFYAAPSTYNAQRTLAVYDSKGALVFRKAFTITGPYNSMDVDLTKNGKGVYVVGLIDAKGRLIGEGKVIVQ